MRTFRKDVNEIIRQGFDWSDRLIPGDSIADSEWVVGQGLDGDNATYEAGYADIDLSGGSAGEQYRVSNRVTTNEGLRYERSFVVQDFKLSRKPVRLDPVH